MRSRLVALIAVPTAVAVALGGVSVANSLSDASDYQRLREVAEFSEQLGAVAHELGYERDETALFIVENRPRGRQAQLRKTQKAVDELVAEAKRRALVISDNFAEPIRPVLRRLSEIGALRATASDKILPLPMVEKYTQIISTLLQFHDQVGQVTLDDVIADSASARAALARAKEQTSKERGILAAALVRRGFDAGELDAFTAAAARETSEQKLFESLATLDQMELFRNTVVGQNVDQSELFRLRSVAQAAEGGRLAITSRPSRDVETWFKSITGKIDGMRTVEKSISSSVIIRAKVLEEDARRAALISAGLVVILLVAVLAIISLIARSLIKPLRRLRSEALHIAGQRLPQTVQDLRERGDTTAQVKVPPIGVESLDEIGEVARAFDEVHREAVRLAGEESKLRANVNAMFVNLSRRSQTLVERQITLIDGLEQGEQDEQRLANLFKLDHLATRMRRNSENLLVLAGQDPPRRWSQPVQLVDVARASLSEVENYDRVNLQVPGGAAVAGQAVNDVIHLLAELVENALAFSPRETQVVVSGNRIDGGGMMVSITDSGIGMTQEELVHANERLSDAPTVDVSVSRRMGLFVVARLAHRHGVRVQLRPHGGGGLTAMVLLPEALLGGTTPAMAGSGAMAGTGARGGETHAPVGWAPDRQRPAAFTADTGPGWASEPGAGMGGSAGWSSDPGPVPSWSGADMGGANAWPSSAQWPSEVDAQWPSADGGAPQWPSSEPGKAQWPSESGAWASGPRVAGGTFDSGEADVWTPSKGAWPEASPSDPPSTWSFQNKPLAAPGAGGYDVSEVESNPTGPIPQVKGTTGDEFLPIFASVESAWFDKGEEWDTSKADAGWSAAEAVREPVKDGSTAAGLPKRVPRANLVPGSADTAAPKGVAPMPAISPERVRNRFSSFQQGFRAARDDISEGRYPGGPRTVDSREEDE
ncbi:nitrate- and nitrite sensing domain-containing protein [Nonomuraea sp. NPDC003754]